MKGPWGPSKDPGVLLKDPGVLFKDPGAIDGFDGKLKPVDGMNYELRPWQGGTTSCWFCTRCYTWAWDEQLFSKNHQRRLDSLREWGAKTAPQLALLVQYTCQLALADTAWHSPLEPQGPSGSPPVGGNRQQCSVLLAPRSTHPRRFPPQPLSLWLTVRKCPNEGVSTYEFCLGCRNHDCLEMAWTYMFVRGMARRTVFA